MAYLVKVVGGMGDEKVEASTFDSGADFVYFRRADAHSTIVRAIKKELVLSITLVTT